MASRLLLFKVLLRYFLQFLIFGGFFFGGFYKNISFFFLSTFFLVLTFYFLFYYNRCEVRKFDWSFFFVGFILIVLCLKEVFFGIDDGTAKILVFMGLFFIVAFFDLSWLGFNDRSLKILTIMCVLFWLGSAIYKNSFFRNIDVSIGASITTYYAVFTMLLAVRLKGFYRMLNGFMSLSQLAGSGVLVLVSSLAYFFVSDRRPRRWIFTCVCLVALLGFLYFQQALKGRDLLDLTYIDRVVIWDFFFKEYLLTSNFSDVLFGRTSSLISGGVIVGTQVGNYLYNDFGTFIPFGVVHNDFARVLLSHGLLGIACFIVLLFRLVERAPVLILGFSGACVVGSGLSSIQVVCALVICLTANDLYTWNRNGRKS